MLLHAVLNSLVDSFFPRLAEFDDEIDELEDAILVRPTNAQLGRSVRDEAHAHRRSQSDYARARRIGHPSCSGVGSLPGMTPEAERYFRDVYDHLIRISDLVDSYRDLLSSVLDTHLSTVSNRLNVIMKQLTIIATRVHAADVPDGLLRPELRLARYPCVRAARVPGLRCRSGDPGPSHLAGDLLAPRLAARNSEGDPGRVAF